jgi:tetratricopeptide (TPR) repeat protein
LLQRFNLVERVRLDALLQEQGISRDLIDASTAAQTGRLAQASRLVLGSATVYSEEETILSGNIVRETGEIAEPMGAQGRITDVLDLEKELALQTAAALGHLLTESDRARILANRPRNLTAFLSFSNGLMAEDLGDFRAASEFYQAALRADPNYAEARNRRNRAVGQQVITTSGPGNATAVSAEIEQEVSNLSPETGLSGISTTLVSAILDVASHQSERSTKTAGTDNATSDVQPDAPPIQQVFRATLLITIVIPR